MPNVNQSFFRQVRGALAIMCLTAMSTFSPSGFSQEAVPTAAAIQQSQDRPVPTLVRHQGALPAHAGKQLILSFSIYVDQTSRSPVWHENQLVQLGSKGEFTVLLGAESSIGLPESLFADGQPRWLGIAVEGDIAEEQRSLLVSVPYAMKAADSESLGGQPASSFVTQEQFTSRFDAGERAWLSGQKNKTSGITGITAGNGLTGGGKSGNISLAIDPKKVPLLSAANVFTGGASFGSESKITGASSDWMLVVTNTSNTAKGTLLAQAAGGSLGLEGASPSGYGVEGLTTTGTGVAGKAGDGFGGFFTNNSAKWPALSAGNTTGPGVLATAGSGAAGTFENSSVSNAAVFASNSAATVGNTYGIGVQATAAGTGAIGVYGIGAKGVGGLFTNNNATYAALAGENSSPGATAVGVYGSSSLGQGVYGTSTAGSAVYGISNSGDGLDGRSNSGNGVNGVSGTAFGVLGFSSSNFGVAGESTSGDGVYGTTVSGNGVYGQSSNKDGVVGVTGNTGYSGVYGQYGGGSAVGRGGTGFAGVWGDAGAGQVGVVGSADDNYAGAFTNKSSGSTLLVENEGTGDIHTLFHTIMATSPLGSCGFGGNGDLSCTGQVKALVATNDARTVETYSVQSPENWLEDFGSGSLENGRAVIHLDSTFAAAANTGVEYHVFLTPKGDAEPIFVTNENAAGFEVRESGHGGHNISFDYRIVARRRGLEQQRMVEVTEKLKSEIEAAHAKVPKTLPKP